MPKPADGLTIAQLVQQYAGVLYRYAFRLTGSVHDAEDLVQQTFAVAQEKLHTVQEPDRVGAWLMTTLRRNFYKTLRKRTAVPASSLELDVASWPDTDGETPTWDGERLQIALTQLPDGYRLALMMFYFEDLSYQEIAQELDVPVGTVMSRLARAKAQLRRILPPDGHFAATVDGNHSAPPLSGTPAKDAGLSPLSRKGLH